MSRHPLLMAGEICLHGLLVLAFSVIRCLSICWRSPRRAASELKDSAHQAIFGPKLSLSNYAAFMEQDRALCESIDSDTLISVVIPFYNEGKRVVELYRELSDEDAGHGKLQLIFVDGGSTDGGGDEARACGAHVISLTGNAGRGAALNAGGSECEGELMLFLHCDTQLPKGWAASIRSALKNQHHLLGAFAFGVDGTAPLISMVVWGTNLRCKYRHLPFGDQALHMRRTVWEALGGFPEQPLMEDYQFVKNVLALDCPGLTKPGKRVYLHPAPALTSVRRWTKNGTLRTLITNQLVQIAYGVGISPQRLFKWYYSS